MLADQAESSTPQQTTTDPRDSGFEMATMTKGLIPAGRMLGLLHHLSPDGVPKVGGTRGGWRREGGDRQHPRSSRTLCVVPASGRQTHNDSSFGGTLVAAGELPPLQVSNDGFLVLPTSGFFTPLIFSAAP